MRIAGTAGASIGVYQDGEAPYFANFGWRDVENKLPVSEKTIFPICSQTKLFTTLSMGTVVEDSTIGIEWDTRIKDVLPDFDITDDLLREHLTIADVLCHRHGMTGGNFYLGSENNILIAHSDSMKFISDQVAVLPFRQQWSYNNLGYELAGLVLDKVLAPRSWADAVRETILQPLNMDRTFTGQPPSDVQDVSKAYNTLDDGTPVQIPTVQAGHGAFGGASGGMFSCVEDLLKLYAAAMKAMEDQFTSDQTQTDGSPLKRVADIFSAKIPLNPPTFTESSYAFGMVRVQLPGQMGYIGFNPDLIPGGMPTVAQGIPSRLVFYHQGSLPGALSMIVMIPSLKLAAVVATNSLSLNDCPDLIMQTLLEEILEAPIRNDYISVAKTSIRTTVDWYDKTVKALNDGKTPGTTPSKPLQDYVGVYWNKKRYIKIVVTLSDDKLSWAIQGLDSERFELDHYQDDIFTWIRPRNYMAARGRWVDDPPSFWKIKFLQDHQGEITCLNWVHDTDAQAGEDFYKDS